MQDLLAGQIDFWFGSPDQLPLVRDERIKAYAVTSETRLSIAPDIPTFAELGLPALSLFQAWFGLFAPKGTPKEVVGRLNAAAVDALADRCGLALPISDSRFSRASDRRRRRSARW
jgi:tripartite-type tricarboxylate transporter receptor subunit TctC